MKKETFTIPGQAPAKSNTYQVAKKNGHGSIIKTDAMHAYEMSFFAHCPCRNLNIDTYFKIKIDVFFKSMKNDLDNAAKVILDCLQQCHVIKNDNKCMELHMFKYVDKENPRSIITIEEIEL